jgi:hypothetical protein
MERGMGILLILRAGSSTGVADEYGQSACLLQSAARDSMIGRAQEVR